MSSWRSTRSFGPTVSVTDGKLIPSCARCAFSVGNFCTHVKPGRTIPDVFNTPEWCALLAANLRDTQDLLDREAKGKGPRT